jgi:spore coat protein U-like protein
MRRTSPLRLGAAFVAAHVAPATAEACTISVTSVAFGTYDTLSPTADDGTGALTVACHPSVSAPIVTIEAGLSGSILGRQMYSGATPLGYNLYSDAAHAILWGNGVVGSAVTLTGGVVSGGQRRFNRTIYGRIPALQNVATGVYSDSLVITVTF